MNSVREIGPLIKAAVKGWVDDRATSMGAALAYYTAFSMGPLLIIATAIAGIFFGRDYARAAIVSQLRELTGDAGAKAVSDLIGSSSDLGGGGAALIVGIAVLLIGATTAFVELQDDLDRIWKAEPRAGGGIVDLIRSRVISFGMVLGVGFLLVVSLALGAVVAALGNAMFAGTEIALHAMTFGLSFGVTTLLFAMIFKILPNVSIEWKDVWIGAAISALLFEAGKFLIGLYIGKSSVASSFGAAGPFVVLMVWIYYSTQIFLLGAEFTRAYAKSRNPARKPDAQMRSGSAAPEVTRLVPTGTRRFG